jgi:hypothetical protein
MDEVRKPSNSVIIPVGLFHYVRRRNQEITCISDRKSESSENINSATLVPCHYFSSFKRLHFHATFIRRGSWRNLGAFLQNGSLSLLIMKSLSLFHSFTFPPTIPSYLSLVLLYMSSLQTTLLPAPYRLHLVPRPRMVEPYLHSPTISTAAEDEISFK